VERSIRRGGRRFPQAGNRVESHENPLLTPSLGGGKKVLRIRQSRRARGGNVKTQNNNPETEEGE